MLVGIDDETERPRHGTLRADMVYMAECTLATVEELEAKARPPKGELKRQRRMAKFAVSSCITHGVEDEARKQRCPRVAEILENYGRTGKLQLPWEWRKR